MCGEKAHESFGMSRAYLQKRSKAYPNSRNSDSVKRLSLQKLLLPFMTASYPQYICMATVSSSCQSNSAISCLKRSRGAGPSWPSQVRKSSLPSSLVHRGQTLWGVKEACQWGFLLETLISCTYFPSPSPSSPSCHFGKHPRMKALDVATSRDELADQILNETSGFLPWWLSEPRSFGEKRSG